ncbi:MAG: O-methyltransferase [Clostridia bacterium]|nr:O-methyltransferase [Clostridia bacterium]
MIEYDKDAIVYPYITKMLRDGVPKSEGILKELEIEAERDEVPIILPEAARLLSVLLEMKKPKHILEIGCAIGYSALLMSEKLAEGGSILTLEIDEEMAKRARANIERAGKSDVITVRHCDAVETMPTLTGEYDVIFLDGPKAHYIYMLNDAIRLLKKGGLLIADNVLYKGMTADEEHVVRRKITIVKRLRHFIAAQMKRGELEAMLLPLGDGMTVAVKK